MILTRETKILLAVFVLLATRIIDVACGGHVNV